MLDDLDYEAFYVRGDYVRGISRRSRERKEEVVSGEVGRHAKTN